MVECFLFWVPPGYHGSLAAVCRVGAPDRYNVRARDDRLPAFFEDRLHLRASSTGVCRGKDRSFTPREDLCLGAELQGGPLDSFPSLQNLDVH